MILFLRNKIKQHYGPKGKKYAILTYSSAYELYGILDFWNHYICEIKESSKWIIYDSYYKFIHEDYPKTHVSPLTHESISDKRTFQFIVWR